MPDDNAKYAAAVSLIGTSESTSVSRFNTFLVLSAILAAGWVQLVTRTETVGAKVVMTMFCLMGIVAGIVWAGIGGRSRSYVEMYRQVGEKLEAKENGGCDTSESPCRTANEFRSAAKSKWRRWMEKQAGARNLFFVAPLLVAAMFAVFLMLTWTVKIMPDHQRATGGSFDTNYVTAP